MGSGGVFRTGRGEKVILGRSAVVQGVVAGREKVFEEEDFFSLGSPCDTLGIGPPPPAGPLLKPDSEPRLRESLPSPPSFLLHFLCRRHRREGGRDQKGTDRHHLSISHHLLFTHSHWRTIKERTDTSKPLFALSAPSLSFAAAANARLTISLLLLLSLPPPLDSRRLSLSSQKRRFERLLVEPLFFPNPRAFSFDMPHWAL